ncbi:hypothetical protein ACVXHA_00820 [Escherichia coli]
MSGFRREIAQSQLEVDAKGPQGEEKEIESRLEEGCYYLLFDSRTHRGRISKSGTG